MQNLIKYILCLISVISFMTISHYASAQRTMHGQSSIHAEALFNGRSFGAEVSYGQYTLNGYWDTGISFNDYNENLSTGDSFLRHASGSQAVPDLHSPPTRYRRLVPRISLRIAEIIDKLFLFQQINDFVRFLRP